MLTYQNVAGVPVPLGADLHVAQMQDGSYYLNNAALHVLLHT